MLTKEDGTYIFKSGLVPVKASAPSVGGVPDDKYIEDRLEHP